MKRTVVSRPQPKATNRSGQRKIQQQDNLDEFLMFDSENESRTIKQEPEDGAEETEDMITVDFEMNGQKVSAKMSSTMVQFLNENEALRQQIIEKLLSTAGNSGEQLIITEGTPTTITNGSSKPKAPASALTTNAVGSKPLHTNATTIVGAGGTGKARNSLASPAIHQPNHHARPAGVTPKPQETPVPNSSSTDLTKETTGAANIGDETSNTKWDHKMIVALLETYGSVSDKVKDYRTAKKLNIWLLIGSRMRSAGHPVTDDACEKKFRAMKEFYMGQLKSKKVNNPPWEYFYMMKGLMPKEANTPNSMDPNTAAMLELVNPNSQSSSDLSSGGEDLDEDFDSDPTREPSRKKRRISTHETWGVELFRRTYLKVEKKKIQELRAIRKQQRDQYMLQSQRNNILSSIADSLKKRPL